MRASDDEIHAQGEFIKNLFDRLDADVRKYTNRGFENYPTRIQNDVIRLRRELNTLRKMFDWDWSKNNG